PPADSKLDPIRVDVKTARRELSKRSRRTSLPPSGLSCGPFVEEPMDRRRFLQSAGACAATLALPKAARALASGVPSRDRWRTFEVTTRVEVLRPAGVTRVWLPAPLIRDAGFQKTLANDFKAE